MPELATAWVTLALQADGLKRDVARALTAAERSAKINPKIDSSKLSSEGASAGRSLGARLSAAAGQSADFSTLERKMADAGRRGSSAMSNALKLGVAGAATAGVAGVTAVLSKGFDRLKTIDTARFKLQALGNDSAAVAKIMDSALASVKGTSYGLGDAATIAANAVAAGVKPGEELTNYLKLTADASAVAGSSLSDMGRIINQVRTGQKAYTDDLNQLADRGIPIYQWIGEEAGVAAGEVKKLAADGKISSQQFEAAISKHIGGAAQKMGQSFDGAVENLQAATARVGANFLTAILGGKPGSELEGPTEAFQRLTKRFDELNGWITAHGPQIHEVFATIGEDVKTVAGYLGDVAGFLSEHPRLIEAVGTAFVGWKAITGISAVVNGLSSFGTQLDGMPDKARKSAGGINSALALIAVPAIGKMLNDELDQWLAENHPRLNELNHTNTPDELGRKARKWVDENVLNPKVSTGVPEGPLPTGGQPVLPSILNPPSAPAPASTPSGVSALDPEWFLPRPRSIGAIVNAFGDGGLNWIDKPQNAGIYSGRGAGTIFAEEETGGEAYIPLAKSKRPRSLAIFMEVARRFGLDRKADGGITVDELKSYASGISGGSYVRGGPAALTGTDCSGGQAAIANFITGASGRFATGNESQALLARGFQQGDPPSGIAAYWVGWKNGGPGGGHTAGTIMDPEGGNVNVEMGGKSGGGQFGGTASGASEFPNRAWIALAGYGEDPTKTGGGTAAVKSASASVTSAKASTSSAQNAVDKAQGELDDLKAKGASADKVTASEKKLDVAQQKLTAAQERQSAAETRLSEVKDKAATKAEKSGDNGTQDLGKTLGSSIFGGIMESVGLPGFSNILDSPNANSLKALANAFAGPLQGAMEGKLGIQQPGWSPGMPIGEEGNVVGLPGGGGGIPSVGLPGVGDLIKPIPDAGLRQPREHQGSGAPAGPENVTNVSYNWKGRDPKADLLKADAHAWQSYGRSGLRAARPV
ncbi:tape measure protein [Mycolicibacterium lutetiense]